MNKPTDYLRATAFHEAGHAVIAFLEGIQLTSISVVGDKDSDGWLIHKGPFADIDMTKSEFALDELEYNDPEGFCQRVRKKIRVCLAGALAEKKLDPESNFECGAEEDYEEAGSFLVRISSGPENMNQVQQDLWSETESLINEPEIWDAVCRLAELTLLEKELSGERINDLIRRVGLAPRENVSPKVS